MSFDFETAFRVVVVVLLMATSLAAIMTNSPSNVEKLDPKRRKRHTIILVVFAFIFLFIAAGIGALGNLYSFGNL